MVCYQRTKFAFDAFSNISSRITHNKNSIQESIFQRSIHPYTDPTKGSFYEFNNLASPSLRRSFSLNHGLLNQNHVTRFLLCGPKRFYCVDKPGAPRGYEHWFEKLKQKLIVSGLGRLVIVPYTNRTHIVLSTSPSGDDKNYVKFIKDKFEGKILHAKHPQSVRVNLIFQGIVKSLHAKVDKEKGGTGHLEGLNWEVFVVDKPEVNACSCCFGKIVVFTGMLNVCTSDADIAMIMGHEVAHVASQSDVGIVGKILIFLIPLTFLCSCKLVLLPDVGDVIRLVFWGQNDYRFCPKAPLSSKAEADYIGLMLMASAGYDPRVAPELFRRAFTKNNSKWKDYYGTHPSTTTRVQLLDKVMEEALLIYGTTDDDTNFGHCKQIES